MSEKKQTELLIKEAATQIFLKKGYAGARMQDIAKTAGINKALLHYYFRSKEKLFDVIFMELFSKFIGQLQEGLMVEAGFLEKLDFFIDKYISLIQGNPYLPLFVINEISKNPDKFVGKLKSNKSFPQAAAMMGMMMQAMEDGTIKKYPPFHLLMNIISMSVFPFIAKPILMNVTEMNDQEWEELMKDRKEHVKAFLYSALNINSET